MEEVLFLDMLAGCGLESLKISNRIGTVALLYAVRKIPWLCRLSCVDPADMMPGTEI